MKSSQETEMLDSAKLNSLAIVVLEKTEIAFNEIQLRPLIVFNKKDKRGQ